MANRGYTIMMENIAVTAAKTLIRLSAGSAKPLQIQAVYISQQASETSEQLEVRVVRVTTDGTGTAGTAVKWNQSDSAFGGSFASNLTVEPIKADVYHRESFNILNGWSWYPPMELTVIGGERIALELMTAPGASLNISASFEVLELG